MSYSVGGHFDEFIRQQVGSGRYNNASEVVREGLRLLEERELKLLALKRDIQIALEKGGSFTDEDIEKVLQDDLKDL